MRMVIAFAKTKIFPLIFVGPVHERYQFALKRTVIIHVNLHSKHELGNYRNS